tara:strand:+ start:23640 stop:24668 length:1029 start_codon:yes stop_codon:yes gene_type:complete
MADKKISDLTGLSAADVAVADIIPIVDVTAGATKGITYGSLYSAITSDFSIGSTAPDSPPNSPYSAPVFKVDTLTERVGINKATPSEALDVDGNISASGSITGATLAGTLSTGAQPNITSVGTLTSLSVSGSINAASLVASVTGISFSNYTSTATATGLTSINPNQNNVPADGVGNDTTTDLAVDQTGNVVRTTQEATWLLTRAQIDGLAAGNSGAVTLINAPGANKFVLVEKATFLINYVWNGGNMNSGQSYNIQQDGNRTNNIAILPAAKILDIVKEGQSSGNSDTYGIYEADNGYSILNRTYKPDKAITFSKNSALILATAVSTITIKIRYRVYDVASF